MRIGIDGHMIGDHSGGNESYYRGLLSAMKPGTDPEVFLFLREGVEAEEFKNYTIVRYQSKNAFGRNFIEIPKLIQKYGIDVFYAQYFIPFKRPCPFVVQIHDICFEHYKDIFTRKEYLRQKFLIPYAAKHSKKIITISEYSKQDLMQCYGISEDKIEVVPCGVNEWFRNARNAIEKGAIDLVEEEKRIRKQYGISAKDYILSVGNLQPRKNLPRLTRAFGKYQEKAKGSKDVALVLVGKKAWQYEEIVKEAEAHAVVLTGYVKDADLPYLYYFAKGFVYPSLFEGFGIPPLEAMYMGTPVAVSNTSSLPEVVGEAGLYFDPLKEEEILQSIEMLLNDGVTKETLQRQAEKFTWVEAAEKITQVLESIC